MKWIDARKIHVSLDGQSILKDVDFCLEEGEVLGLVGPNGAGKTTLLKVLAGLLKPDSGEVKIGQGIEGQPLSKIMAYLPQGQEIHWPLTVRRIVALGRIPHLMPWQQPGSADETAIEKAMADTDILHLSERSVDHLAGGEKRLVLLARALATQPSMILADEPVQGLDPSHGLQVMELLRQFAVGGRGVIVVLHDLTFATRFCDRVVLLHQGKVMAQGRPEEVFSADHLKASYHIEAKYGPKDDFFILPWRRL